MIERARTSGQPSEPAGDASGRRRVGMRLALLGAFVIAVIALSYEYAYTMRIGPKQPIPFSHRLHAGKKGIGCLMCHEGAISTARAGVPPEQTCLLCHSHIIVEFPQILDLTEHYEKNEPILWERVNKLPDYVYFNHSMHLAAAVDCGVCHGDVKAMDRITPAHKLDMGYCIQCHRDNHVSHDCFTCHR